jgi:hypothetical protein
MALKMTNGIGTGTATSSTCGSMPMSLNVNASGSVTGDMQIPNSTMGCIWNRYQIAGRADGGKLMLVVTHADGFLRAQTTLSLSGAAPAAAAAGPSSPPDGLWRGTFGCEKAIGSFGSETGEFSTNLEIRLANGSGTWKNASASPSNGLTVEISLLVGPSGVSVNRTAFGPTQGSRRSSLSGQYNGSVIQATGKDQSSGRQCTLSLTRA